MCQIISAPAGKKINLEYLDKAQKHNEDGYGVSWYEDGVVKTYKTMNYEMFRYIITGLTDYTKVVHLRYSTVGTTSLENCHPFDIPNGVMFHNGTIGALKPVGKWDGTTFLKPNDSDSKTLAKYLNQCYYEVIDDITAILQPLIGDTINKLVFMEEDGSVTIMNEDLGVEEDGIWYSNDYHLKDEGWCRHGYCKPKKNKAVKKPETIVKKPEQKVLPSGKEEELTSDFVYGTLKRGYGNNKWFLRDALYLGKAKTLLAWTMVGEGKGFPYVVEMDSVRGHQVQGEVYRVTPAELKKLDSLEGISSNHYKKVPTNVVYDDGTRELVTMYVACNKPTDYASSTYLENWVG